MAKPIARLTPRAIKIVGPRLAARAISRAPVIRIPKGIPVISKIAEAAHTRQVMRDIAAATARVARSRQGK